MKALLAFLLCLSAGPLLAAPAPAWPEFAYRQLQGSQLPMQAIVADDTGQRRTLASLGSGRPMVLVLGYYHCPGLCGLLRDDLLNALSGSRLAAGTDYVLIVLSIDPAETFHEAADAKRSDIARFRLPGARIAWHYVTADADTIASVAASVGFRDRFDAGSKQFAHPSGIVFVTSTGIVSGYRLGLGYEPEELRTGVAQAGLGQLARAASPILLLCFHFDPTTGRYTLAVTRVLRLAGLLTVLTIGFTIALALRRERQ